MSPAGHNVRKACGTDTGLFRKGLNRIIPRVLSPNQPDQVWVKTWSFARWHFRKISSTPRRVIAGTFKAKSSLSQRTERNWNFVGGPAISSP